ncbi:MAG TPA: winged helix-turn-helix domain-containing protein, partial [Novosphingobium sp.]|nr:winged helix-turn-helix domain-containing protein [Novosphingobium sp.]
MASFAPPALAFDRFVLDATDERLVGPDGPVHLGRKAYRVLGMLVENRGRLVTKDELFDKAWDGAIVTESSLTSAIKELRRALGDDPHHPRFIESVYGR